MQEDSKGDIFVYISAAFCLLCYLNDYYSLYSTFITRNIIEKINENKQVNYFSLKIRVCIFLSNATYLYFIVLNDIRASIISCSVFLSLDSVLLILRTIYAVLLYKKSKQPQQVVVFRPTVRDDGTLYYRKTIVENPMHENVV